MGTEALSRGRLAVGLAASTGLLGCKDQKMAAETPAASLPAAESAHADEPAHEPLPRRVHLAKEVIAGSKIKTAKVAREPLAVVLELPGRSPRIRIAPRASRRRSRGGSSACSSPRGPRSRRATCSR